MASAHLLLTFLFPSTQPITTISEALDGIPKIYELKSYSNSKNADHVKEVRGAADQVYELVIDISLLFVRRRRLAYTKAHQPHVSAVETWGNYTANRVPLTTDSQKMHALFRPGTVAIGGRQYYDAAMSVGTSVISNTPSIMALRRIDEHRNSGLDASRTFDDEYLDDFEFHDNVSRKQVKKVESSIDEFQNNRYAIDHKSDDGNEEASNYGVTADELFSQDFGQAHDGQEMYKRSSAISASDDAASLLQSFNSAVSSSHTGSYYGSSQAGSFYGSSQAGDHYGSSHTGSHYGSSHTGSHYGSSHTGSYYASSHTGSHISSSGQPNGPRNGREARKLKAHKFLRESAVGRLHGFSFPEEKQSPIPRQNTIPEDDDFSSTNLSVKVSEEGEYA